MTPEEDREEFERGREDALESNSFNDWCNEYFASSCHLAGESEAYKEGYEEGQEERAERTYDGDDDDE